MVLRAIGWIVVLVALLIFAGGILSLWLATGSFLESNLGRTPMPASVDDVAAGKFPVGSYLEIADGYLFPTISDYAAAGAGWIPTVTAWRSKHLLLLMTPSQVSQWNTAKNAPTSKAAPDGILFWYPTEKITKLWPELDNQWQEADARLLEPVKLPLRVIVEPTRLTVENRARALNSGIWRLVFGICMVHVAIRMIKKKRDILWWFDVRSDQS